MDLARLTAAERAAAQRTASAALWRRGIVDHLFHPVQQSIDQAWRGSTSRKFFINSSRRIGKSHYLLTTAMGACMAQPYYRVLYLLPWAKDAALIAQELTPIILRDCPEKLQPRFHSQEKEYRFSNGSIIRLKGTNGEHAQYLRGGSAHLVVLDECAMMDDLQHIVSDVCMPMTMTTNGRILLATTPPRTPGHPSAAIYEELAGIGAVSQFTLRDADDEHIPADRKAEYLTEAGEDPADVLDILAGRKPPRTTTARREYFCEFVTDAASAVVPEFDEAAQADIVRPWPRPPHVDTYTTIDPGMKDRTGILYGYWDFEHARLVIEDESLLSGPNTSRIANVITAKEKALWGRQDADEHPRVYRRISDVDLRMIADLWSMHRLAVVPARKEDSLGAINLMRNMVQRRELIIHPRCVHLIRQLRNAVWNNRATDFAQGGDVDGHYDLVAALKYLCRMIDRHHNPFPAGWHAPGGGAGVPRDSWVSPRSSGPPRGTGLLPDTPLSRRIVARRRRFGR